MIRIIGGPASPYVRKVLAALQWKGIAFEIDPIVPFYGNDEFSRLSPLRRIPVLIDGDVTLCDSSVICQYLEDHHPEKPLYPSDIGVRARARWLEEYGDSRVGDVFIWKLFYDAVIAPGVFGAERNPEKRAAVLATELPEVMDYLEAQMPAHGYLCGTLSIAELGLVPHFANLAWARAEPDWTRWPKTGAWLKRALSETPLGKLAGIGMQLLRTPPPQHREKVRELGLAVTAETVGTQTPRKGPMTM